MNAWDIFGITCLILGLFFWWLHRRSWRKNAQAWLKQRDDAWDRIHRGE